jgi:hypothetical protein
VQHRRSCRKPGGMNVRQCALWLYSPIVPDLGDAT